MSKPTEASFLSDVAEHRMEVLRDDGVYRHLRFKKPRSCDMQFELLTYPGALCYSGDMGSYVFERLPDMFEFFRTGLRDPGRLAVNLSYWSEKIVAADRDGVRKYSAKLFEDAVREVTDAYIGEYGLPDGCPQEAWSESLQILLASADDGSEQAALTAAYAFNESVEAEVFIDFWERDLKDYTYRFIWCCYAVVWGIRRYDAQGVKAAA